MTLSSTAYPPAETDVLKKRIREVSLVYGKDRTIVQPNGNSATWLFDFRICLMEAPFLAAAAKYFWNIFEKEYPFQVSGMESAAIPLIAAIALEGRSRGTPISSFYLRKSRKKTGLLKQIEGIPDTTKVILVDDLINSGRTFEKQVALLEENRLHTYALFAFVRFKPFEDYPNLVSKGIAIHTPFSIEDFGLQYTKDTSIKSDNFSLRWSFRGQNPLLHEVRAKATPLLVKDTLFIGGDDGSVIALNVDSGEKQWSTRENLFNRRTSQVLGFVEKDQRLVFTKKSGQVTCVASNTGSVLWKHVGSDWISTPPSLSSESATVLVGTKHGWFNTRNTLSCISLSDGSLQWETPLPDEPRGAPEILHDVAIIGCADGNVLFVQLSNGKTIQKYKLDAKITGSVSASEGVLFVGTESGISCVDARTGACLWSFETEGPVVSKVLPYKETVIFSSLDKNVYCAKKDTGTHIWNFETKGRVFATPAMMHNTIFIGSNDSRLYLLDGNTGKMTSYHQSVERITNEVVFHPEKKLLFLTVFSNEVFCLAEQLQE